MPVICRWGGVKIVLYFREIGRHKSPHFHVLCAEHSASIEIGTEQLFEGDLPPRQMNEVLAWAKLHRHELMAAWNAVQDGRVPGQIDA
jgi:hypothetical protein